MPLKTILINTDATNSEIDLALSGIANIQAPEPVRIEDGDRTLFDTVSHVRWYEEDMMEALESAGYPVTPDNLEGLNSYMHNLEDLHISDGWDAMSCYITDAVECGLIRKETITEEYDI